MRLDALDLRILQLLREDARLSFREVASRLGSTTPTVSARVKALEDVGILRGYHARVEAAALGGAAHVLTVEADPREAEAVLAAVAAFAERAFLLPGGRIVAHVTLRPPAFALAHLHERLVAVPGLRAWDAREVVRAEERLDLGPLPESVEVPCHQCQGPIHGDPVKGRFAERTHVFCCRQCLAEFRRRFDTLARPSPAAPRRRPRADPPQRL